MSDKVKISNLSDKVVIILTTFNPVISNLRVNLNSYVNQAFEVIICDNSDDLTIQSEILKLSKEFSTLDVLTFGKNLGIAQAQNLGVKRAMSKGVDYFIELDQDTFLDTGYVNEIQQSFLNLKQVDSNAFGVGPVAINKKDNEVYHSRKKGRGTVAVDYTLSSGFIFDSISFLTVGGKDESLFIDLVDWDWCMKAKNKGRKTYVDSNVTIKHMLGDGHFKILFWKIGIPSPFRHYYQYRNQLLLVRREYVPIAWKAKRLAISIGKVFLYVLFFDKKSERVKYIFDGIKDGLQGRSGKMADE
jgi:rhamnosyltransferase